MAHLHIPQARHAIHDARAIGVGQPHTFTLDDDARAFPAQRSMVGERVQMVLGVQRPQRIGWVGVGEFVHHTLNSKCSRSQGLMTRMKVSYSPSLIAL